MAKTMHLQRQAITPGELQVYGAPYGVTNWEQWGAVGRATKRQIAYDIFNARGDEVAARGLAGNQPWTSALLEPGAGSF